MKYELFLVSFEDHTLNPHPMLSRLGRHNICSIIRHLHWVKVISCRVVDNIDRCVFVEIIYSSLVFGFWL